MAVSSQVTLWSLLSGKKKKIEKEKGVGLVRYFLSKPDVQIKVTLTPWTKLFLCTTMSSYLILPPLPFTVYGSRFSQSLVSWENGTPNLAHNWCSSFK